MKYRDSEISGSGCDNCNVVSVLCEIVNEATSQKAYDEYLKSATHSYCQLAIPFANACRREMRKIKAGRPSPRPPFSCCRSCFADLLTAEPKLTYPALVTALDDHDKSWDSVPINDAPDESDTDALETFLINECHTEYVTSFMPALDDLANRNRYLDRFRELLRLSARLAKRLGETDAAKNLLDALGMTLNDSSLDPDTMHKTYTMKYMSNDTAEAIYDAAYLGWRQLWTAVEYAALKPLPAKKASRRKN